MADRRAVLTTLLTDRDWRMFSDTTTAVPVISTSVIYITAQITNAHPAGSKRVYHTGASTISPFSFLVTLSLAAPSNRPGRLTVKRLSTNADNQTTLYIQGGVLLGLKVLFLMKYRVMDSVNAIPLVVNAAYRVDGEAEADRREEEEEAAACTATAAFRSAAAFQVMGMNSFMMILSMVMVVALD